MRLEQAVRQSGRNMSRQRAVILDALRQTQAHPSAQEIHESVRTQIPRITLATVYRNLHVLEELGLARRIETDGQCSHFDADVYEHAHAYCLGCGHVRDVAVTPQPELTRQAQQQSGFDVTHCNVVFGGFCPNCQSTTKEPTQER